MYYKNINESLESILQLLMVALKTLLLCLPNFPMMPLLNIHQAFFCCFIKVITYFIMHVPSVNYTLDNG